MLNNDYLILDRALTALSTDFRERVLSLSYSSLGVAVDLLVKTGGVLDDDCLAFLQDLIITDETQHNLIIADAMAWEADDKLGTATY